MLVELSKAFVRVQDLYTSARIQQIEEAAIEMEAAGFAIDVPYFNAQAGVADKDRLACLSSLRGSLGDLGVSSESPDDIWSSSKQLAELLHGRLGLPKSPYWGKGRVDIDAGEIKLDRTALEWVASRCVGPHLKARRCVEGVMELRRIGASLKYLEKLPRYVAPDGFVHPVCGPAGDEDDRVGAITGRFGMKNPEGQQIPRDKRKDLYGIRKGFIAPAGMSLVVRDYTALEVVIMANMAEWLFGDTLLLELTAPGQDIHAYNAHRVFGTLLNQRTPSGRLVKDFEDPKLYKSDPELAWFRDAIKAVWYKLQYGGTVHGFATSLRDQNGEPVGRARAEEIVGALYEAVPSVPKWQQLVSQLLRRDGGICAIDGRYVDYSQLIARGEWAFQSACRGGQNLPMQAGGAHIIGCAMADALQSNELRRLGAIMELQVHDELRWRCPADNVQAVSDLTGEIMCGAFPLKNLRSSVGIGQNWDACK
jgi:DNA polymerase-1